MLTEVAGQGRVTLRGPSDSPGVPPQTSSTSGDGGQVKYEKIDKAGQRLSELLLVTLIHPGASRVRLPVPVS